MKRTMPFSPAIEATLEEGPRTPDLGGKVAMDEVGTAIARRVFR
ncbi:hypothetical protein LJR230_003996 [Trinickia sp. LjRoot230]